MVHAVYHEPVMLKEVMHFLQLKPGMKVVDATIGTGGHARAIIEAISPGGLLIGIDRDQESLELAQERLADYASQCVFVHSNFFNIDTILSQQGIRQVDAFLLDLGISSFQLNSAIRGFSFTNDGPLDMRMDRKASLSAFDLVNNLTQEELATIFWRFGEERYSRRIAGAIAAQRRKSTITTTTQLSQLIDRTIHSFRHSRTIHPATRVFQALRIAVNRELESLELFLEKAASFLSSGGRMCVISFHSLEDRIVKRGFRQLAKTEGFRLVEKKPFIATLQETKENPRSRSAKLRILERL